MLDRLVILGAAGDLSTRFLIPSIGKAMEAGRLDHPVRITGVARADWSNEGYRNRSADALADVPEAIKRDLLENLFYIQADATDPDALAPAFDDQPAAVYLALPPGIYSDAIRALESLHLPDGSRIIIEKPFGSDLDSAIALNQQLRQAFPESRIYRIDHFTAMQAVEIIPALRFANRMLEPVWNRDHIEQIDVIWEDISALDGRASYYDTAGALRDMTQNHLLQVLCMLTMEPPDQRSGEALRDRKVELLNSIRIWDIEQAARLSYRARYTAGSINGREVPDYVAEEGVDPENRTETFAQIELEIDNDRWRGVPVRIRTGKGQGKRRREANIVFRGVETGPFQDQGAPNAMQIQMLPDRIHARLMVSQPDDPTELREINLAIDLPDEPVPAHGALILDALRGDQSRFIRDDEAESSWRVVQPFLDAWARELTPLREYPAGTQVSTDDGFRVGK
jgi:glucose-6-phosphate 1-dehydrogenase